MYKKNRKLMAILTAALMMLNTSYIVAKADTQSVTAQPTVAKVPSSDRLWGSTRYETSVAVSSKNWTKSDYVVVASGEGFADALCAAPLAKMYDAPILLSPSSELNAKVADEVKRLSPKQIFIIGGTGAISDAVKSELEKIATVERIWGMTRYETSEKVAEKLGTVSNVVITYGGAFPDSLSIAPIAAMDKMPILLSEKDAVPEVTAKYLSDRNISKTYVIGGEGVLSKAVENSVKNPTRIYGNDRYETNLAVIKNFESKLNLSNIYLAAAYDNTNGFADALAGSALAAKNSAPVVLTDTTLPAKTSEYIKTKLAASTNIVAIGGQGVLSDSIVNTIVSSYVPVIVPTIETITYDKANTVFGSADASKPEEIKANVDVKADNVTINNANVAYDLYVHGNNASLTNVSVKGTLFVDPGDNGTANFTNVTAANIKVLSGATESIHFNNVNGGTLTVDSKSNVRIVTTGTTKINNTVVTSYAILDSQGGTLGQVNVQKSEKGDFTLELRGKFEEPVVVETAATIKTDATANVAKLQVEPESKDAKITLDGAFKNVEVNKESKLEVADNAIIENSLKVTASAEVKTSSTSNVAMVEVAPENKNSTVTLNGSFKQVEVNKEATVQVAEKSTVRDTIKVTASADIKASASSSVSKVEVSTVTAGANVKIEGTTFGLVDVKSASKITVPDGSKANVVVNAAGASLDMGKTANVNVDKKSYTVNVTGDGKTNAVQKDLTNLVKAVDDKLAANKEVDKAAAEKLAADRAAAEKAAAEAKAAAAKAAAEKALADAKTAAEKAAAEKALADAKAAADKAAADKAAADKTAADKAAAEKAAADMLKQAEQKVTDEQKTVETPVTPTVPTTTHDDYTPPVTPLTISNITVTTSDVTKNKDATSGAASFNGIVNSIKLKGLKITTSEGNAISLVISSIKVRGEEWITDGKSITTQLTNGEVTIGSLLGSGIDTGNDGISLGNLRLFLGTGSIVIQGYVTYGSKQTTATTITITLGNDPSNIIPTSISKSWGQIQRTGDNTATVTINSNAGTVSVNDFAQDIITVASANTISSVVGGTTTNVSLLKNALKSYIASNDTLDLSLLKDKQDKTVKFGDFTVTFVIN